MGRRPLFAGIHGRYLGHLLHLAANFWSIREGTLQSAIGEMLNLTVPYGLPVYADLLKAPRPFRVPRRLGRIAAGRYITYMMTEQGGVSNAKAKESLGWNPTYPSWREGFRAELAGDQG